MFRPIIPTDLTPSNQERAELLAAGLTGGALPTEQAAVALMLRLPYGVGLRDDVWRHYVTVDDDTAAYYSWTDLANDAVSGDLPLSRGERLLVRAAAALANPMCSTPLNQVAGGLDTGCFDLLVAAMWHAAGRANPADEVAEVRRLLDAERVETARLRGRLAELEPVRVRGTEDGDGTPLPDGVDGHPVGYRLTTAEGAREVLDAGGQVRRDERYSGDYRYLVTKEPPRAEAGQMRREAEHVETHAATGGACCDGDPTGELDDDGPVDGCDCEDCEDERHGPGGEYEPDPAARIAAVAAVAPQYVRPVGARGGEGGN